MTTNASKKNCVLDRVGADEFLLIRAGTAQETALFGNPLSALQVTQVCISRTIRLDLWIDVQDYSRDFPPVSPLAIGLQKARVSHDMLLVVGRQNLLGGRSVRDVRIEWRIFHKTPCRTFDKF
jgi:hypothetical protein